MVKISDFDIIIEGRKDGEYFFDYDLNDEFFSLFEHSLIEHANLKVNLLLNKKNKLFEFLYKIQGEIELVCDRCLDTFMYPINVEQTQLVKIGEEYNDTDEHMLIIPENQQSINVAQWLYEDAALTIPIRKIHPLDENGKSTCNPKMLTILNKYKVEDKEIEEKEDSPFEQLKSLLND